MRGVQITLDDELLASVDRAARRLKTTRSGLIRQALSDGLAQLTARERERKHRQGYERNPVGEGEFDVWENEQVWPDP